MDFDVYVDAHFAICPHRPKESVECDLVVGPKNSCSRSHDGTAVQPCQVS